MSHEIRTPLNSIVGFSNLLASEKDLDEADKQLFAKTINQSCDLLLVLINDILEVSRLQSGQMKFEKESCSVKELVDDLYLAHQLLVPTHLRFSKEAEGDLFIYTDKKRLSQVITNFLTNACKFTNSGYIKLGFKHLRGRMRRRFLSRIPGSVYRRRNKRRYSAVFSSKMNSAKGPV